MKLFSFGKHSQKPEVQSCTSADRGLLSKLHSYDSPAGKMLYTELRHSVPVIDAALSKLVRLIGDFRVICDDKNAQAELDRFCSDVQVDSTGMGLKSFVSAHFDQLLTYGKAVGEIVAYTDGEIAALYNAPQGSVELVRGDSPIEVKYCRGGIGAESFRELAHPELIVVTLLNPEPGSLKGVSLLEGLPFVSEILMKIFTCVGQNFDRAGNVRFAVTYNPPQGTTAVNSRQRVKEIASEWSKAMRDKTRVCDFVSVGDVSIKAIGADSQILDCDVPVRHILEQIVAKLSIPPFLLGLSWSSTERMSSQQADILTSELDYYRSLLSPAIIKISQAFLKSRGLCPEVKVEWSNISLQDETELASARLDNARAAQIEQTLEVSE